MTKNAQNNVVQQFVKSKRGMPTTYFPLLFEMLF